MSQIMITLAQIKANDPYADLWAKVLKANGGAEADHAKPFAVSSMLESNDFWNTLWALKCLPKHNKLWCRYAWWCAMQAAIGTDDERVHRCLDIVDKHIKGEASDDELNYARDAVVAAVEADVRAAVIDGYAHSRADDRFFDWFFDWVAAMAAAMAADRFFDEAAAMAADRFFDGAAARAAAMAAQASKLKQILDAGEWVE